jgi:hypothetical protein
MLIQNLLAFDMTMVGWLKITTMKSQVLGANFSQLKK